MNKIFYLLGLAIVGPAAMALEHGVEFFTPPMPMAGVVWNVPRPIIEEARSETLQHPPANRPPLAQGQTFWQASLSGRPSDSNEIDLFVGKSRIVYFLDKGEDISESKVVVVDDSSGGFKRISLGDMSPAPKEYVELAGYMMDSHITTNAIYQIEASCERVERAFAAAKRVNTRAVERKLFMSTDGKLFCNLNLVSTDAKADPLWLGMWMFALSEKDETIQLISQRTSCDDIYSHTVTDIGGNLDIYVGCDGVEASVKLRERDLFTYLERLKRK